MEQRPTSPGQMTTLPTVDLDRNMQRVLQILTEHAAIKRTDEAVEDEGMIETEVVTHLDRFADISAETAGLNTGDASQVGAERLGDVRRILSKLRESGQVIITGCREYTNPVTKKVSYKSTHVVVLDATTWEKQKKNKFRERLIITTELLVEERRARVLDPQPNLHCLPIVHQCGCYRTTGRVCDTCLSSAGLCEFCKPAMLAHRAQVAERISVADAENEVWERHWAQEALKKSRKRGRRN